MACYHPLRAFKTPSGVVLGGVGINADDRPIMLPCGKCIGCRLERSRQWAVRLMHEASLHRDSCFITLTYSPKHLPSDGSLCKRHVQLFMKSLRKHESHRDDFGNLWHLPIRYFLCGEYGEELARPHYHIILFGFRFPDLRFYAEKRGCLLYTSKLCDTIWELGECKIGAVTFESAAYVARYCVKKVTGDKADEHYMRINSDGEVFYLQPEFVTMSRRPGIAFEWFRKFGNEVYPSDEVISRGFSCRPPRYYDSLLEAAEPSVFDAIKQERVRIALSFAEDNSPERLRVREVVTKARVGFLKRGIE